MIRPPGVDRRAVAALITIMALGIAFHPGPAHAGMQSEIDHLLQTIETSDCTFTRNGNRHGGQEAGAHIRKKYAYVKAKVNATEDFIRHAATRSSMSGRPYHVTCDGIEMPTAEWLSQELAHFRREKQ
jgi:hypothetical protein